MAEKRLSEELRHCLEDDACGDCQYHKPETKTTCQGLLQKAYEVVKRYEEMEENGQILIVPQIKKNKTIYWIWGDEIMPVLFKRIISCVVDNNGNPHVMCEMITKKDRTFVHTYRRKPVEYTFKAGDKRYFHSEDIGKTVFLTKEAAEKALKEMEDRKNGEIDKVFK